MHHLTFVAGFSNWLFPQPLRCSLHAKRWRQDSFGLRRCVQGDFIKSKCFSGNETIMMKNSFGYQS